MKKIYFLFFLVFPVSLSFGQDIVITGVFDGPLTGGLPKTIELFVINDIGDLSAYGIGSANNGGGTDGEELTFPASSASKGDFIYIATESNEFTNFFGFAPNYTSSAVSINGDDAIELYQNGTVIDVFGDINVDGTGQSWDYLDGWAYRNSNTGPDGTVFNLANWSFSGVNSNDGETSNTSAANPFPIGTYTLGTALVKQNEIVNFSVFPNPVNDGKIWINTQNNTLKQVEIIDILGKQVISTSLSGRELNVSKLRPGIYILKVLEDGKTATRKLVIR